MKLITKEDIMKALKGLNLDQEDVLVVYGDLSKTDYLVGGAQTVIDAIREVMSYGGTMVMPAHIIDQDCPTFFDKSLPEEMMETVKNHMPAFDVERSSIEAGELSSTFALGKGVIRSNHPLASFIAFGNKAEWLMSQHKLDSMFGEDSPLQKLYAQDAKILCLGVDYESLTALHLMEYLSECREQTAHEAVIMNGSERELIAFEDLALDSTIFKEIGTQFESETEVLKAKIGSMTLQALDYRSIIDFGVNYLSQ